MPVSAIMAESNGHAIFVVLEVDGEGEVVILVFDDSMLANLVVARGKRVLSSWIQWGNLRENLYVPPR